jgi:anti-anti-sigma factor
VASGELDLASAPALRQHTRDAVAQGVLPRVVVDLLQVELLDSVSLGILLGLSRRVAERDGTLRLVVSSPQVHRTFELTGTVDLFDIVRTVAAAVSA